jgi:hypothetical protein
MTERRDVLHHEVRRHKGLGIASFIIVLFSLVLIFLLFAVAGVLKTQGRSTPEVNMVVGITLFACLFLDLIGVGLGIAGLFDRGAKKAFPVLGIVIGGSVLLLTAALVLIGLKMTGYF